MLAKLLTFTPLQRVLRILPAGLRTFCYWKIRALKFGKRSVLNLSHVTEEYDAVTSFQKNEIFPFLKKNLRGDEKLCLDFGCGPGRFTRDLAVLINGKCIGVDPIRELIELAPNHEDVEYRLMRNGKIPLPETSVDLLWCCLVLGGIADSLLHTTAGEMIRVLRKGGLLILIENTSPKTSGKYWVFRSTEDYRSLFPEMNLVPVHQYEDSGETISIIIGRRKSSP